ncbi:MAG TPA: DHA2 family efflux MFS transporter permease subunit, partial [Thermoanaerobaculia bacterium]|nr:DHA2 family efflux MFS transporter permease subunit [Thermoanaerobaculia bacterium]
MPAEPLTAEGNAWNRWLIAISVMAGTFMVVLDTTVVNVALPHIAGSLSATVDEATWALTSYLTANAIILPMTGWLANYFGRKRLLMVSVGGFTLASCLCGLSPNLPILILFRVIQGLTGGVMQPLSQAVLLETFPPHERGKAMGFWGLGIVVAPIIGPVLGGWLTAVYSWRWIFYINVPVGVVALVMMQVFIFDPPYIKRGSARIDYWGIGLLAVGFGALQIALDKGQEEDWLASHLIVALMVIAAVALVWMIVHELKVRNPIVHLRVFANRTYASGVLLMTLIGFVLYGSLVLLPLLLQTLMGYPPLQAGIALAPRGFGSFIAMPLVGIIMTKIDPRKLLFAGFVLAALTLFWFSWLNLNA